MIYLDHAATTRPAPEVLEAMLPYYTERFGNASSLYGLGRESRKAVEHARELAAAFFGCRPQEILFTSGGSEADNLAVRGVMWALRERGDHLITTEVEHHAVINAAQALEGQGFRVTYLRPDRRGFVSAEQVREAITERTVLISVMHGNNEVGTILPVAEIGRVARERGVLFHTDAVQTVGQLPLSVRGMPCDLLSMSAHKVYGPKGVGLLYRRIGVPLATQISGGDQEFGQRAGTENVPGIVGLGKALELAFQSLQSGEPQRLGTLRDRLVRGVLEGVSGAELTGADCDGALPLPSPPLPYSSTQARLPNHASFRFPGIEGEPLLLNLDMRGICGSSGAACASGEIEPSHVLLAMGYTRAEAHGALRLTLGRENTEEEIEQVVAALPPLVESLRKLRTPAPAG
jgi:cysteine desulfurase